MNEVCHALMRRFALVACLSVVASCTHVSGTKLRVAADEFRKIEFDVSAIDADGLRGPPDGKVSVSYEFAIPDKPACKAEVSRIDPSVQFMCGSRGRIGAKPGECLCVGSTHQKNFRQVLQRLAELPCVARIIECHFE